MKIIGAILVAFGLVAGTWTTASAHTVGSGGAAAADHVYVWNQHGDERGRVDERPVGLVLSEASTINKVTWENWGSAEASGRGLLTGTWCLPDCQERPYTARVKLSGIRQLGERRFYTTFEVEGVSDRNGEEILVKGDLPTP
jgi:hypothetical protein